MLTKCKCLTKGKYKRHDFEVSAMNSEGPKHAINSLDTYTYSESSSSCSSPLLFFFCSC
jgi:hypothetical protein